ncbi:unnamed protein product [Brachionus calyciflorus]|uniref:Uncharacterized protein n=1 Tax=Brachionus calyciflorus TaxID=104777 RepID=A0A814SUP4_9BILA|nr:unnamed protein product [Brachionus calyciflorus]
METSEIIKSLISDKEELLKLAGVEFTNISASEDSSDATASNASSSCEQSDNDDIQSIDIETSPKTTLKDLSFELSPKTVSVSSHTSTSALKDASFQSDTEEEIEYEVPLEIQNRCNSR